ncbi:hypothetical protein ZIOFF_025059 [Zingiber officinale]|uniref:Serine hydroxymethyltransferase-like domain-containing protein n=1 Tax=Zingiber officinale TaxID=94328 RepID=A0A8J5H9U2_ZINOF|nr:hypothetical protein ZIOFF_025059 [Zingiber officinale]
MIVFAADLAMKRGKSKTDTLEKANTKKLQIPLSSVMWSPPPLIRVSETLALQGGPHNHQIAALAVALKQAMSPGFEAYARQVRANVVALGNYLMSKGYKLVTDGTENHLVEKLYDLCNITVNKNAVFGDSSALAPGGVRIEPCMVVIVFISGSDLQKEYTNYAYKTLQMVGDTMKDSNKKNAAKKHLLNMLGSISAPAAFAKFPPMSGKVVAAHTANPIHVTSGFIRIYSSTISENVVHGSSQKNGHAHCMLSYSVPDESTRKRQIFTTAYTASLDIVKIIRMSGYGLLVLGSSLNFWYNFLSKILPKQDIITILKKILIGQTTFGPVMAAVFFSVNAFLQGESGNEIFSSSVTGKFLTVLSLHSMLNLFSASAFAILVKVQ